MLSEVDSLDSKLFVCLFYFKTETRIPFLDLIFSRFGPSTVHSGILWHGSGEGFAPALYGMEAGLTQATHLCDRRRQEFCS